jgi:hypothetical protein
MTSPTPRARGAVVPQGLVPAAPMVSGTVSARPAAAATMRAAPCAIAVTSPLFVT